MVLKNPDDKYNQHLVIWAFCCGNPVIMYGGPKSTLFFVSPPPKERWLRKKFLKVVGDVIQRGDDTENHKDVTMFAVDIRGIIVLQSDPVVLSHKVGV